MRNDEGRDALGCSAYAGFQPTKIINEAIINPCRDLKGLTPGATLTNSSTGLSAALNSDIGGLLMRGVWERGTDCIIDAEMCDVNQQSYLKRNPANMLK